VGGGSDTRDVAVLYRLALENAAARSSLRGVGNDGIAFGTPAAEEIAAGLGVPARSVTEEKATCAWLPCPLRPHGRSHLQRPDPGVLGVEPPGWVEDLRSAPELA
jgi:hypothetical protein